MGGHGGLNILPQKKWNVYNYDNRAIVDKDKKQAAAKKRAEYEKNRLGGLQGKIDVLLEQQGIKRPEEKDEVQHKESLIAQELRKMSQKSKHINLFQNEQKIIENREIQEVKRLQQAQFLKDKDTMDLSSKFLGTYADEKAKPWYAKHKGNHQVERKSHSSRDNKKYEPKQIRKEEKRRDDVERSREKREKHDRHHEREQNEAKSEIEIMRQKRLRREQKQRQKIRKLKLLQGR